MDDVVIRVKKIKDKPGKPVVIVISEKEGHKILTDVRCKYKDSQKCDKCRLKFQCYTCDNLEINYERDIGYEAPGMLEVPLNERIEEFLAQHRGLDN